MKLSAALLTVCGMLTACVLFAAPPAGNEPTPTGRGGPPPSQFTRPSVPLRKNTRTVGPCEDHALPDFGH